MDEVLVTGHKVWIKVTYILTIPSLMGFNI